MDIKKKVYINAILKSLGLQYFTAIILFLVVPLGLFYFYFIILKFSDYSLSIPVIFFILIMCFVFILLVVFFLFLRKHWVVKIITDNTGIAFFGFLKNVYSRWTEVISMETFSTFLGEIKVEVRTKNGNFNFPLSMKEKNQLYPKISIAWIKNEWQWIDANGIKKKIAPENNPLYIEIQKYLRTYATNK